MSGDVVDLERGDDLVTLRTLVRLVTQDASAQGFPLGGPVPAAQRIVRARMFSGDAVDLAASAGCQVWAAWDAAQMGRSSGHRGP
jgi:hypothetical protein